MSDNPDHWTAAKHEEFQNLKLQVEAQEWDIAHRIDALVGQEKQIAQLRSDLAAKDAEIEKWHNSSDEWCRRWQAMSHEQSRQARALEAAAALIQKIASNCHWCMKCCELIAEAKNYLGDKPASCSPYRSLRSPIAKVNHLFTCLERTGVVHTNCPCECHPKEETPKHAYVAWLKDICGKCNGRQSEPVHVQEKPKTHEFRCAGLVGCRKASFIWCRFPRGRRVHDCVCGLKFSDRIHGGGE